MKLDSLNYRRLSIVISTLVFISSREKISKKKKKTLALLNILTHWTLRLLCQTYHIYTPMRNTVMLKFLFRFMHNSMRCYETRLRVPVQYFSSFHWKLITLLIVRSKKNLNLKWNISWNFRHHHSYHFCYSQPNQLKWWKLYLTVKPCVSITSTIPIYVEHLIK